MVDTQRPATTITGPVSLNEMVRYTYDRWMESVGIPIHKGYFIEDLRTVPLGRWDERECDACFIQLAGQEGVSEARVTEIRPGATLPPMKLSVDEATYVCSGRGLTTVWSDDGGKKSFEWQEHSMFVIPRGYSFQVSNARGDQPVRLLNFNYLPIAMSAIPDAAFFFNNPNATPFNRVSEEQLYSAAQEVKRESESAVGVFWVGNFFPDMRAWDKLVPFWGRGAGGTTVFINFPGSEMSCHMSVFPTRTYKRAHRHGPGRVIVIPSGEGFSVMWQEGQEKIVVPWHECSMFVPPDRWFHQHFNLGAKDARYLAFHPLWQFSGHGESVEDRARDQIDYSQEEPWIREKFEGELSARGIKTDMPEDAYKIRDYEWKYE
jgi:mannose-6-phosphate isomerase-like protein (cupin superfamily)